MHQSTTVATLRKELGLTLEQFGEAIGIASKGNVSIIERTGKCSPSAALAIERLSNRRIDAGSLNAVIAAARQGIAA